MLTVQASASKSISHRTLMGAALTQGVSTVHNVLMSRDIQCTMAVLTSAGAQFEPLEDAQQTAGTGAFVVTGMGACANSAHYEQDAISCDMHESGTSCRLLTGILSTCAGRFRIHGAPRMHERPIQALTQALTQLGVSITFEDKAGYPPLILEGGDFQQDHITMDSDASSQYLSGLLLAAPRSSRGLVITLGGKKVVSWPYVGLTLQTLEDFNISFHVEVKEGQAWKKVDWRLLTEAVPHATRFCIEPSQYAVGDYIVEGDWSGASYLVAAGALGKNAVCVQGLRQDSLQGDKAIMDILQRMGGVFAWQEQGLCVQPSALQGIEVDMGYCPDLVPTVAVMAAFAKGVTTITNCAHLRIKESDRIAAPAAELRKLGVQVEELDDGLRIHGLGQVPTIDPACVFSTHNDHRMAMSLALLSLHGQKIQLDDAKVVEKSFPHFWHVWSQLDA